MTGPIGKPLLTIFETRFSFGRQSPGMLRTTLLLLFICPILSFAQKQVADSFPKIATVDVTVTNMQLKPQKGEEVIFRGEKTGKIINGFSNAAGKLKIKLPPGDNYIVSLKCIS